MDARKAGETDFKKGVPRERNPFQYTSNIFKQAQWATGWDEAKRKAELLTKRP